MSTVQTILDQLRVRLEEADARRWTDATLILYISRAEQWLAGFLSRVPKARRFRVLHESATLAANATTLDLTTLAKSYDWLIEVSVLVANVETRLINFEDGDAPYLRNLSIGGGSPISRIDLQDDNLVILPSYGTARTLYLDYGWIPLAKTSGASAIETPTKYDGDLVDRALHFALADAGLSNTKYEEEYAVRLAEIEDLERSRRGISNERVMRRANAFSRCR